MLPSACVFGAVGRRWPSASPPTIVTVGGVPGGEPAGGGTFTVTDDVSFASSTVAEMPKSQLAFGRANSSASTPVLRAFGTLYTRRDEQLSAVTLPWRSLMSEKNADTLNVTRRSIHCDFMPIS